MISIPATGDVESTATGEHGTKFGPETAKVLGAPLGHFERHGVRPSGVEFDVPRGEVPVEHFGDAIIDVGDVAVERNGHDCDNLRHCDLHLPGRRD
jgi:diaminopimelate decarboxylase